MTLNNIRLTNKNNNQANKESLKIMKINYPLVSKSRLSGFRSRWTIPTLCNWLTARMISAEKNIKNNNYFRLNKTLLYSFLTMIYQCKISQFANQARHTVAWCLRDHHRSYIPWQSTDSFHVKTCRLLWLQNHLILSRICPSHFINSPSYSCSSEKNIIKKK